MAPHRSRPPRPVLLVLVSVALLLAACGQQASTTFSSIGETLATPPPSVSPGASPGATWPLTLTDDAGRSVTLPAPPQRVVSLAPSNTEIVCALGACDRLAGVTDFDDYPASVTDLPKVVVSATVDPEKVVAARPDLVLAAGNGFTPDAVIRQLSDLGLRVLTLYPSDLDGVEADISLLGRALDREASAGALVVDMRDRIAAISQRVAGLDRPRTFYEVSVYQGVIYTAGEGSFLASLISHGGRRPGHRRPRLHRYRPGDPGPARPAAHPARRREL